MTESEITTEIAIISSAITNIALTGEKYETGSGHSKRIFEAASLNNLIKYRSGLENQLKGEAGEAGVQLGF